MSMPRRQQRSEHYHLPYAHASHCHRQRARLEARALRSQFAKIRSAVAHLSMSTSLRAPIGRGSYNVSPLPISLSLPPLLLAFPRFFCFQTNYTANVLMTLLALLPSHLSTVSLLSRFELKSPARTAATEGGRQGHSWQRRSQAAGARCTGQEQHGGVCGQRSGAAGVQRHAAVARRLAHCAEHGHLPRTCAQS